MKSIKLITIILCLIRLCSYSQKRCHSDEYLQALIRQNPSLVDSIQNSTNTGEVYKTTSDAIIYIPVVVHVIQNGSNTATNISDAQIHSQITILNNDFNTIQGSSGLGVVTQIRFCLAQQDANGNQSTGITRHTSAKEYFIPFNADGDQVEDSEIKSYGSWPYPYTKYLNIWVCDVRNHDLQGTFYGYSSPFIVGGLLDGVVINYKYFGNIGTGDDDPNFAKGKTATHEVGHWCGLWHTFQGGCTNIPCYQKGDEVCDTDPVNGPAWNDALVSTSDCSLRKNCLNNIISAENYMEYNYDPCLSFFTAGQRERMRQKLNQHRNYIYKTSVTDPGELPIACSQPSNLGDVGGTYVDCSNGTLESGQGFFINGEIAPSINSCPEVVLNFTYDGYCTRIPNCFTYIPCDNDISCGWLGQLLGTCSCGENQYKYFLSVYYNCDANYNCLNETAGQWFHSPDEAYPLSQNIGQALNFTFEKDKYYRVKFAADYNCSAGGGWAEQLKNVYILPDETRSFNNLSPIPSGKYQASQSITIQNSTINSSGLVTMVAGNEINILPNTDIISEFDAYIEAISDCSFGKKEDGDDNSNNNNSKNNNNNSAKNIATIKKDTLLQNATHDFQIMPNPSDGKFTIRSNENPVLIVKITIHDILGNVIYQSLMFNEQLTIDLSIQSPGIYFVKIYDQNEQIEIKKIIIQ